jgi:hypothetical protein
LKGTDAHVNIQPRRDMGETSTHQRILYEAARDVLLPLGLRRRGRSRTWLDDRSWWIIVVEFQPSWSKGSYLNAGAMWLWKPEGLDDHLSFDFGSRVDDARFISFESEDQFRRAAESMASIAGREVERLRSLFPSIRAVAAQLADHAEGKPAWPPYHAGVAAGLAGDTRGARSLLSRVAALDSDRDWVRRLAGWSAGLVDALDEPARFHAHVERAVRRTREALRLPEKADLDL